MGSRTKRISAGIVLLGIFVVLITIWTISRRGAFTGNIESLTPEFEATFVRISSSKNWSRGSFDAYGKPVWPLRSNAVRQGIARPNGPLKNSFLDFLSIPIVGAGSPPAPGAGWAHIEFGAIGTKISLIGTNKSLLHPENLEVRDNEGRVVAGTGGGTAGDYNRWIVDLWVDTEITEGQYEVVSRLTGEKLFRFMRGFLIHQTSIVSE